MGAGAAREMLRKDMGGGTCRGGCKGWRERGGDGIRRQGRQGQVQGTGPGRRGRKERPARASMKE